MNHDAFISGFLAECRLQKSAAGGRVTPKPPVGPSLPPADNPGGGTAPAGGSSIPPIGTANNDAPPSQARLAKGDDLAEQQTIARQEGANTPGTLRTFGHNMLTGETSGDHRWWNNKARAGIDSQIQGIKPGESITPKALTTGEMLDQDTILQRPELLDHAKRQAVAKSQEIAKATPLNELQQMNTGQMGGNNPLPNAIRQHVGNDPRNLEALTKIIGNKPGVYGMAGVGPGLKAKFTPQNFQFGQFANDHWGKILAGLAALLMGGHMAGQMGQGQPQQQRQPEVWD